MAGSLSLSGCGGSSHDGGPTLASLSGTDGSGATPPADGDTGTTPPAETVVFQQASCPEHVRKITIFESSLANLSMQIGASDLSYLTVHAGANGISNLTACLVTPADAGYVPPPADVVTLLGDGSTATALHLIINGDIDKLSSIAVSLAKKVDVDMTFAEASAYKIVAYVQNEKGLWERSILETGVDFNETDPLVKGSVLRYSALVGRVGYYTLEN
ncbi:MAG: hypothetical protein ACRYGK_15895 [Janthinobacterium lividum]